MTNSMELNGVRLTPEMLEVIAMWREKDYTSDSISTIQDVQDVLLELSAYISDAEMKERIMEHLVALLMLKNDLKIILLNQEGGKK